MVDEYPASAPIGPVPIQVQIPLWSMNTQGFDVSGGDISSDSSMVDEYVHHIYPLEQYPEVQIPLWSMNTTE